MVRDNPFARETLASKPIFSRALTVLQFRRGWPEGWEACRPAATCAPEGNSDFEGPGAAFTVDH